MVLQIATVAYLFIAIAMVVLILMQRGSGAGAGAGFGGGGGSSASVFGARGSANFLSKATKWLAIVFFILSLGMAMYVSRGGRPVVEMDMGVMGSVPAASETTPAAGSADGDVPAAPELVIPEDTGSDVPVLEVEEPAPEDDPEG